MAPVVAQECPGSNSNCSRPKNSVAPATTMLSRPPPPSPHQFFTTPTDSRLSIPPLNAERFSGSFEHFCSVRGLVVDYQLLLRVGERGVDLYSLHKEFMNRRGYNINERRQEFWLKIGRQLNFIDALDTSPAAAEVADRLETIYELYLQQFDAIYVMSFMQELYYRGGHVTMIG